MVTAKTKKKTKKKSLKTKLHYHIVNTLPKRKKLVFCGVMSVLMLVFLVCLGRLSNIWLEERHEQEVIDEITEEVKIVEKDDGGVDTVVSKEQEPDASDPYWDFIKMKLTEVDFSSLKEKNSNTKGWVQVLGTNVNYPFVQTGDNAYYLTHSFDKSESSSGWVFADYRNALDGSDSNMILYAHGRWNGTMFGTLKNVLVNGWKDKTENHVVRISTESENSLWQVFSVYKIETTSDYLKVNFASNKDFEQFAQKLIERSEFDFQTKVGGEDRILTLSTCYNSHEKMVLHAKLIKRESRAN